MPPVVAVLEQVAVILGGLKFELKRLKSEVEAGG